MEKLPWGGILGGYLGLAIFKVIKNKEMFFYMSSAIEYQISDQVSSEVETKTDTNK